ncbi:MAG: hypothetical protein ACLFQI_11840 [Halochromatium sp.]
MAWPGSQSFARLVEDRLPDAAVTEVAVAVSVALSPEAPLAAVAWL